MCYTAPQKKESHEELLTKRLFEADGVLKGGRSCADECVEALDFIQFVVAQQR